MTGPVRESGHPASDRCRMCDGSVPAGEILCSVVCGVAYRAALRAMFEWPRDDTAPGRV